MMKPRIRVMFVCLGNICRSPLAHGLFNYMVSRSGLIKHFDIASSGTGAWHIGQPPDRRMRHVARRRGVNLEGLRAQQFTKDDLALYDHILVMDKDNLYTVLAMDTKGNYAHKVRLFRSYDPESAGDEVPDPYYRGNFNQVYDIVERTTRSFFQHLVDVHNLQVKSER